MMKIDHKGIDWIIHHDKRLQMQLIMMRSTTDQSWWCKWSRSQHRSWDRNICGTQIGLIMMIRMGSIATDPTCAIMIDPICIFTIMINTICILMIDTNLCLYYRDWSDLYSYDQLNLHLYHHDWCNVHSFYHHHDWYNLYHHDGSNVKFNHHNRSNLYHLYPRHHDRSHLYSCRHDGHPSVFPHCVMCPQLILKPIPMGTNLKYSHS